MNYYGHSHNWYRIKEPVVIGDNISERKSGIERTKKCKKRELVLSPPPGGETVTVVHRLDAKRILPKLR